MNRSTHVDLVQRDTQRFREALLRLCVWLVLLLVVCLEDVVLLLGQTWLHIDSETGEMVCIWSMMLVIEVSLCVVVIGKGIRLAAEVWIAEIDVVIVVCICRKLFEVHGEAGCAKSECCWCVKAGYRDIFLLPYNPSECRPRRLC